jgi:hypothetical protein
MQLMKSEAGQKIVYQRNLNNITPASLETFLGYAAKTLAVVSTSEQASLVVNIWHTGLRHMVKMIRTDADAGQSSRFRWGASDVLSSWANDEVANPIVD